MANMRLFEPTLNDPFESMFRRFMAPLRAERNLEELDIRVDVVDSKRLKNSLAENRHRITEPSVCGPMDHS